MDTPVLITERLICILLCSILAMGFAKNSGTRELLQKQVKLLLNNSAVHFVETDI